MATSGRPSCARTARRNPYYESMREVAPGDLVFSFADTRFRAFGIARSYAYEAPKPLEFGSAGRNWDDVGWRVDVQFRETRDCRQASRLDRAAPPTSAGEVCAPLLASGRGRLTPSIDHLFDRGFISFLDDGRLLISPVAHQASLVRMGVPVDREALPAPSALVRRATSSFIATWYLLQTRRS